MTMKEYQDVMHIDGPSKDIIRSGISKCVVDNLWNLGSDNLKYDTLKCRAWFYLGSTFFLRAILTAQKRIFPATMKLVDDWGSIPLSRLFGHRGMTNAPFTNASTDEKRYNFSCHCFNTVHDNPGSERVVDICLIMDDGADGIENQDGGDIDANREISSMLSVQQFREIFRKLPRDENGQIIFSTQNPPLDFPKLATGYQPVFVVDIMSFYPPPPPDPDSQLSDKQSAEEVVRASLR
ncbi:MAG: hypothetical protein M1814_001870 [Vezdaea aestivalis]|nr:MAG: hypothetical protein M1814_001870 [Vezdaea aestivalis]